MVCGCQVILLNKDVMWCENTGSISIFQNASKCTISTFSAEINTRKSCWQMRFSTSKYTKMCLQPGLRPGPHWGGLQHSPDPISAGGKGRWWKGGLLFLHQTNPPLSALRAKSCASMIYNKSLHFFLIFSATSNSSVPPDVCKLLKKYNTVIN